MARTVLNKKSAPAAGTSKAAGVKKVKVKLKIKLLNLSERKELKSSVQNEDVLACVLKRVPAQLMGHLFPEREVFWHSCFPVKLVL